MSMHLYVSSCNNPDLNYIYLQKSKYASYYKIGLHPYDKIVVSMMLRTAPVFIVA